MRVKALCKRTHIRPNQCSVLLLLWPVGLCSVLGSRKRVIGLFKLTGSLKWGETKSRTSQNSSICDRKSQILESDSGRIQHLFVPSFDPCSHDIVNVEKINFPHSRCSIIPFSFGSLGQSEEFPDIQRCKDSCFFLRPFFVALANSASVMSFTSCLSLAAERNEIYEFGWKQRRCLQNGWTQIIEIWNYR